MKGRRCTIKYQWLKEYQDLKEEMETLRWKIEKSETELERWLIGGDLSKVRITRDSRAAHLESEIERLKCFLGEKELAEEALIIMVGHFRGLDNIILKMKYIDGKTLKEIANELGYSYQHIVNKHASVVNTIKLIESIN